MKKGIETIVLIVLTAFIIYLLGYFISMQPHPFDWMIEGRVMAVFILVAASFIIIGIKNEI